MGKDAVEFVLQFHGVLPASSRSDPRTQEKHEIRKSLRPQLTALWRLDANLQAEFDRRGFPRFELRNGKLEPLDNKAVEYANHYAAHVGHHWFVPLITKHNGLCCHLDIKFLRRGQPGDLVKASGDIDNRIKTLFDALRMPQTVEECGGEAGDPDDLSYFYCVLEDDALITRVTVDTQRLLTAPVGSQSENEVALYVSVAVKMLRVTAGNLNYL
jgi:hypothetical protein